jgi:RNA polymerase subunit RPABC4/transcription elongation factor Spt4
LSSQDSPKKLLENVNKIEDFNQLYKRLNADPRNIDIWFLMAEAVDDPSKKADCYRQIIKIDPENRLAQIQLKKLITQLSKTQSSEKIQKQAITTNDKPRPSASSTGKINLNEEKKCPNCGNLVGSWEKNCLLCGYEFAITQKESLVQTINSAQPKMEEKNNTQFFRGIVQEWQRNYNLRKWIFISIGIVALLVNIILAGNEKINNSPLTCVFGLLFWLFYLVAYTVIVDKKEEQSFLEPQKKLNEWKRVDIANTCRNCGKQISRNASTCPNCGEPNPALRMVCPVCGSANFTSVKKGFSIGKAAAGGVLLGPLGLLGGALGSNDTAFRCQKCGYRWTPI